MLDGGLAQSDEQVREILTEITGVPTTGQRVNIDADLKPLRSTQRKRLEHASRLAGTLPHTARWADRKQRPTRQPCDQRAKLRLMGDLALGGPKASLLGDSLKGVQQHRLADAPEPRDEHALLRAPSTQTSKQNPERLDLLIAARQRWRTGTSARRIGVADRIDRRSIPTYT